MLKVRYLILNTKTNKVRTAFISSKIDPKSVLKENEIVKSVVGKCKVPDEE